eukprot:jgi/Mesen1/10588/ME000085S09921
MPPQQGGDQIMQQKPPVAGAANLPESSRQVFGQEEIHVGPRRAAQRTSLRVQANALLRKDLVYQKRNCATTACLICVPVVLCLMLAGLQAAINALLSDDKYKCGCKCFAYENNGTSGKCVDKRCGLQYSDDTQAFFCAVPHPPELPAFLQVGKPQYRAVAPPGRAAERNTGAAFSGLPAVSCRSSPGGCPATLLYTGSNKTLADGKL